MRLKIQIMVENTTPSPKLRGEYGFAAWLEVDDTTILFDTGSQEALLYNAQALKIDLNQIDKVVLSHGHFDHTGGLVPLIQQNGAIEVYAHPGIFTRRYSRAGEHLRNIGCSFSLDDLNQAGIKFVPTENFTEITTGVYVSGRVPRNTAFETAGGDFVKESDGEMVADDIDDDMFLVIDHPEGLIIISGCAHAGIVNTIQYARQVMGKTPIKAFIGGTHLMTASEDRLTKTISFLKTAAIEKLIVCHCTGFTAAAKLHQHLPGVIKGESGMIFNF